MQLASRLSTIVLRSPERRARLAALGERGPKGAWLSAGFVRNAVFDELCGPAALDAAPDLDVIYFDPLTPSAECDRAYEQALRNVSPGPWEVKNQVRMAARNGHAGYRDVEHALAHFPETATAVAVRLLEGRLEVLAPHGLEDLFDCIIRRSPPADPRSYRERLYTKRWQARWKGVRILASED